MSTLEKYEECFTSTFNISKEELEGLQYQDIQAWDSVGHMVLIAALEEVFSIMLEPDDIIDFSSFEKGKELLSKYDIEF